MANNLDFAYQNMFFQAFKFAPIGMALVSIDGQWLHVNSSLCQILGYSESEFVNNSFQDFTHPEDINRSLEVRNQLLADKMKDYQLEKRYIHKNGFTVSVFLAVALLRDEHRQPLFFITQIKDITESKLAEADFEMGRSLRVNGMGPERLERSHMEEQTRKIKDRYESVIRNNADAIWVIDLEDIVLEVNPAFEQLFGWSAVEIHGKKLPIIPKFLKDSIEKLHQSVKSGKSVVGFETTRQRKDGVLLDVEATLSPIRDHNGTVTGITGICRDVTRRNRSEEELKSKTRQLESFIENNADAIWMIDLDDSVLDVNPAFKQLFGWSADEIKGKKLPIIPNNLINSMDKIHQRIKLGETVIGLETIRRRKDGVFLDVEATLSPLRDGSGAVIGITGICRDVTRRKRAEDDLKAKTKQLESFIENNADAILIFNNEGVVEKANKTFENVFQWSKEEIIGLPFNSLPYIPAEYVEETNQLREQVESGNSVIGVETIRKRKNGEMLNVVLTISPILNIKKNRNGWSVTLRDITDWKMAQEHMQHSEKLSVAGQLAAGIAHEIRNPITSIKGFIQLMKSGFGEKQKYFDIMSSEIERIELILSELLILAKPQSVKYSRKDIRVLLSHVITLLDTQAILNNVQFITEFKPGVAYIYCDENQLKQVFINFIKNSIESMPKGGNITIQINSNSNGEMLIHIIDQGCGIPKEVLSKLGQPFYTTKEKGTGLGFMVSKKIIENHSGKINVESEVDKGTKIEVTLPISVP